MQRQTTIPNERSRYSNVAIALHWLIALIIIANLAGGLLVDTLFAGADPATRADKIFFIGLHKSFGLTVIVLTLVRIAWRLANPPPPFPASLTRTEMVLARATQLLFYGLMLAMPLSGWAMVSTGKRQFALQWFGLFAVPQLPLPKSLGATFGDAHEWLGYLTIAMIVLHVAATLKHVYFDRDNLLLRMWPARRRAAA